MANSSATRVGVITAVRFAAVMAIVLWPANGWAQKGGIPAEFKPTIDQKFDARPVPAKATGESGISLMGRGYVQIGTISATQPGDKADPEVTKQLEAAILQRAADAGGDLVCFTQTGEVEARQIPTGKRSAKYCDRSHSVSAGDGRGGVTSTNVCDTYSGGTPIAETVYFLDSKGTVWRYDPKIASEAPIDNFIEWHVFDEVTKMQVLLDANPGVIVKRDKDGWTLLHLAARDPRGKEVTELLLAKGADVNARRVLGWTPLHDAADSGSKDVAELLLAKGADVNARDENGTTPLDISAEWGKRDVAELLLAKGADVNARDKNEGTPLYYAASENRKDVAVLLLAHGADVNARDHNSKTLLHTMAENTNGTDVAELLLAKGLDVNARDASGQTPLHLAKYYRHNQMENWLRQHGGHE